MSTRKPTSGQSPVSPKRTKTMAQRLAENRYGPGVVIGAPKRGSVRVGKPGELVAIPKGNKSQRLKKAGYYSYRHLMMPVELENLRPLVVAKGRGKSMFYAASGMIEGLPQTFDRQGVIFKGLTDAEQLIVRDAHSHQDYMIFGLPIDPATKADFEAKAASDGKPDTAAEVARTKIINRAAQVLGSNTAAEAWFTAKSPWLDNKAPAALVRTDEGRKQVDDYLTKVDYGVYV